MRTFLNIRHATISWGKSVFFQRKSVSIRILHNSNVPDCKVDIFKRRLDTYISTIPDEPQVQGYTAQRRADSNSILHMGKFADTHWPSQVEVFGEADSPSRRGCRGTVMPKILQGNKVRYRETFTRFISRCSFCKKIATLCNKSRHPGAKNQNRSFRPTSRGATVGLGLRL